MEFTHCVGYTSLAFIARVILTESNYFSAWAIASPAGILNRTRSRFFLSNAYIYMHIKSHICLSLLFFLLFNVKYKFITCTIFIASLLRVCKLEDQPENAMINSVPSTIFNRSREQVRRPYFTDGILRGVYTIRFWKRACINDACLRGVNVYWNAATSIARDLSSIQDIFLALWSARYRSCWISIIYTRAWL